MEVTKHSLREDFRSEMKKLTQEVIFRKSQKLCQNLLTHLQVVSKNFVSQKLSVGVFAPLEDELQWQHFLSTDELIKRIDFAFPGFDKERGMIFRKSNYEQLIETFEFGVKILAPKKSAEKIVPDVLLVPGLSFSPCGERLGRGKGFYDRYLETYNGIAVGVCFDEFIKEKIPTETHDQTMDYVVSETQIFTINKSKE